MDTSELRHNRLWICEYLSRIFLKGFLPFIWQLVDAALLRLDHPLFGEKFAELEKNVRVKTPESITVYGWGATGRKEFHFVK